MSRLDELTTFFAKANAAVTPHVRELNSRVAAWAVEVSWKRIVGLGLVALIVSAIIAEILGLDRDVKVVVDNPHHVKVDVSEDDGRIVLTPRVDGKPRRPVTIMAPGVRIQVPGSAATTSSGNESGTPADDGAGSNSKDGKDGKDGKDAPIQAHVGGQKVVIDSHGVVVVSDEGHDDKAAKSEGDAKAPSGVAPGSAPAAPATPASPGSLDVQALREDVERTINDELASEHETEVRHEANPLWGLVKAMMVLAFAYIIAIKITATTKRRADAMVKSASEVADRESLKRQVLEARMQMMQAQVEPHFLFNTLASVDYLIETDPARASTMQKNLIQYLRGALPQMRGQVTNLGREVDLVRAFLEILKVRMEERLDVQIVVPEGLRSADFPPMMLQSLAENAIKHGLEPKADGGSIRIFAEVADGELHVTVADTGLGITPGKAPTAGGGVGLSNIRERLSLLYGDRGRLVIEANRPSGTRAIIVVPYQHTRSRAHPVGGDDPIDLKEKTA